MFYKLLGLDALIVIYALFVHCALSVLCALHALAAPGAAALALAPRQGISNDPASPYRLARFASATSAKSRETTLTRVTHRVPALELAPPRLQYCRADPGCRRRRLWRHRHQPALRAEGSVRARPRAADAAKHLRRAVVGVLDAHGGGVDQVCRADPARRQQRRGRSDRDAGAGVPGRQRSARAAQATAADRHLRHRHLLRRRRDHAGHLGAVGGRGPRGRRARPAPFRRACHAGRADFAVPGAAPWHRQCGQAVRADHGGVVPGAGFAGRDPHRREPAGAVGPEPALRGAVHGGATADRVHRARLGGALRHRRRSAVCRHGPLRQAADPAGLVQPGDAGPGAELLRPGRDAAVAPGEREEPVLRDGADLGVVSADRAGHLRHRDRVAGADHRGVFGHQAGNSTRLPAAHAHPAHLGQGNRPDLRAVHQLESVRLHRAGSAGVRFKQQARRGLRHRRHDRHADHHHDDILRDPLCLELPVDAVHRGDRLFLRGRLRLLRRQLHQGVRRRLVPAGDRRADVHADDDLEAGPPPDGRAHARRRDRPEQFPGGGVRQSAGAGARHRGVPVQRGGHHADRAAAQPEAQQGAARHQPVRHGQAP